MQCTHNLLSSWIKLCFADFSRGLKPTPRKNLRNMRQKSPFNGDESRISRPVFDMFVPHTSPGLAVIYSPYSLGNYHMFVGELSIIAASPSYFGTAPVPKVWRSKWHDPMTRDFWSLAMFDLIIQWSQKWFLNPSILWYEFWLLKNTKSIAIKLPGWWLKTITISNLDEP